MLERANEAAKRQQDIQEAKEIDGKIDILNNELVWSQIILKEKEAAAFKRDVEVAEKQFLEAKEKYETEKIKITQLSESILKIREEWDEFKNGPNPYEEEMNALEKNKEELESKISEFTVNSIFYLPSCSNL